MVYTVPCLIVSLHFHILDVVVSFLKTQHCYSGFFLCGSHLRFYLFLAPERMYILSMARPLVMSESLNI